MHKMWNLWHGCHKKSAGCKYCYVYRSDAKHGRDSSIVYKTKDFLLPIAKKRDGTYKYPSGTFFWTCFTSDFLLEDCDEFRIDAWNIIRERSDCTFFFITKRIDRFMDAIPNDWFDGYDNVHIGCTVENQEMVDYRLPIFKQVPIKHKVIINEPLLENLDIEKYLDNTIEEVVVGGESGLEARNCNYDWVLNIRDQCVRNDIPFWFKQTGAHFIKDNKFYFVKRKFQHSQARKAGIDYKRKEY